MTAIGAGCAKQTGTTGYPELDGITAELRALIAEKQIPGAVSIVATRDHVLHACVVGEADVASHRPMTMDTMFWIASMTKPITGCAIMALVDDGKVSVDDPVSRYIPEFALMRDQEGRPVVLTLKHLLTHTSGMGEASPAESAAAKELGDLIPAYIAKGVQGRPGEKWAYCQSGMNTLGRVVEVVSGERFDAFLKRRFFDPLGMKDTTFYLTAEQRARTVKPHACQSGEFVETAVGANYRRDDGPPFAHAGLYSTAPDMLRFGQMLANRGTFNGRTYLSRRSFEKMTAVQTGDIVTGFTPGNAWGLGCWIVREPQGVTSSVAAGTFGHGGAYGTWLLTDARNGLVYVLMTQRSDFIDGNADASPVRERYFRAVQKAIGRP